MIVYEYILDATPQGIYGSKEALGVAIVDMLLKTKDERLRDYITIYAQEVK